MGIVYLARNRLMGRDEALKVLAPDIAGRPGILEKFLHEFRAVASLHHPNIVMAYTAFPCGRSIAFATEYVDGHDLASVVSTRGPLPVVPACLYVHHATSALGHAHEHGQVHRDVKPGNLMLSEEGDRPHIKISNFGLSRAFVECRLVDFASPLGEVKSQTVRSSTACGQAAPRTLDVMAPEQIVDPHKADIRADIYSLGCTLYYLLSGSLPFRAASPYEVLRARHSMEARPLNLVRPEVPFELAAIVAKMLAKEPERRFQTPQEVAQALLPFFSRKPVFAYVPDPDCVLDREAEPGRDLTQTARTEATESPNPASSVPWSHGAPNSKIPEPDDPRPSGAMATTSLTNQVWIPTYQRACRLAGFTAAGVVMLLGALRLLPVATDRSRSGVGKPDDASRETLASQPPEGDKTPPAVILGPGPQKIEVPRTGPEQPIEEEPRVTLVLPDLPDPPFATRVSETTKPVVRKASEGVAWRDSYCIARSEEDVRQAFERVEARFRELLLAQKELQEEQERAAAEAVLSQDRESLLREENELRIRWQATYELATEKRRQRDVLNEAVGNSNGPTHEQMASLSSEIRALDYQILLLKLGTEQRGAQRDELTDRLERVRASRREPAGRLQVKMEERREAYRQALRKLRESIDLTRLDYDELRRDQELTARIQSKNQGLAEPRFKLGPSPWFLSLPNGLKRLKEPALQQQPARGGRSRRRTPPPTG
jgi:serine/threonine protein kinase